MKIIRIAFCLIVFASISTAAPQDEALMPDEPLSTMRLGMKPCYRLIPNPSGGGARISRYMVATTDECPAQTSQLPKRTDRPDTDAEIDSQGNPFPHRME